MQSEATAINVLGVVTEKKLHKRLRTPCIQIENEFIPIMV